MTQRTYTERATPEAQLFDTVTALQGSVQQVREIADDWAAVELTKLAEQTHDAGKDSPLGELDEGVVKVLYDLGRQIRKHVADRTAGNTLPKLISAHTEHTPAAFVGALMVASHANDTDINGYFDLVPITATPTSTLHELYEQFHEASLATPVSDPFA